MEIVTKAAIIQPGLDDAEHPNGTFDVILSAQSKDRDGDVLKSDEWKQPLPEHIVFDMDHGMSVATTVGSGKPFIDDEGNLRVKGTYSSIPRAQEVRTLVNEGHIRTTSVAFMTDKSEQKDGKPVRELLNGAFVAIPSNRDAKVLSSKSLDTEEAEELGLKLGNRNNVNDRKHIQAAHDHLKMLGASCGGPSDDSQAEEDAQGGKALAAETDTKELPADAAGEPESLTDSPEEKALDADVITKDADTESDDDPGKLAQACDAAIDEAIDLISQVDASSLPAEVQQAIALVQAADNSIDALLAVLNVPDPDEDATDEDASDTADETAASDDELSAAVHSRALSFVLECEALSLNDLDTE